MYSIRVKNKTLLFFILSVVISSFVMLFLSVGSASASSGNVTKFDMNGGSSADGCFDDGALMNVVVHVELVDETGTRRGWGNNYSVLIESWDPGDGTRDAGIVPPSGNNWQKEHTFNPAGEPYNFESCDPPGGGTKAQSLTFEGAGTEPKAWKLSCGYTTLGNQNRKFRFTGKNAPDNIPSGYKALDWGTVNGSALISESSKNDINGFSYRIVLTYRIERIRTATLTPSPSTTHTINVGESFTFQQRVTASNRQHVDTDTFGWSVTGESPKSGTAEIAGDNPRASSDYPVTYDTRGTRTRTIGISSAPGYATKGASATQTLTVNGWDITSDAKVDGISSGYKYALVGTTVTFSGQVCNSGPAPVHIGYIDGDWYIPGNTTDFTVLDLDTKTEKDKNGCASTSTTKTYNIPGEYCAVVTATPAADNNSNKLADKRACVQVINVSPEKPAYDEYEKGSAGIDLGFSVAVNNGGAGCPAGTPVSIVWNYKIGAPINVDQNKTFTYGNGTCSSSDSETVTFNDAQKTILNKSYPGTTYPTSVTFNGVTQQGSFGVYEVPFARFYGNDIYATNGEIRFNDTGDANTAVQRGSVNQYAALAFGNVKIDTSSFRTLPIPAPNPPNGLDVAGVGADLNRINATSVYNDVKNNLPTNCTQINSGGLNAPQNGCYILNDGTVGWSNGIPFIGWGDTIGAGITTYDKKVTISNPTNKMLMIVGDIVNNSTTYTDPENTGVLLVVSEGPIVIDNNVRRVDAILVSKSGIYTCGIAGFGPLLKKPQNGIHETCREPLNINGALSAPTIDFRRAVGSRYLNASGGNELQNCQFSKGIQNCDERGTNLPNDTGATAEIVNFPSYLYFAKPFLRDTTESGAETDAIFVAPPRL